jgi:AraC-like DNA-binding protein
LYVSALFGTTAALGLTSNRAGIAPLPHRMSAIPMHRRHQHWRQALVKLDLVLDASPGLDRKTLAADRVTSNPDSQPLYTCGDPAGQVNLLSMMMESFMASQARSGNDFRITEVCAYSESKEKDDYSLTSLLCGHPAQAAKGGLPSWKIKKLDEFIHENLASRLSGEDLADVCALSRSHFQRLFHRCFGRTPQSYITGLRLRLARQLLAETDRPIKFIALECGMADQAHLTKAMKREWHTTPLALRRCVAKGSDGSLPSLLTTAVQRGLNPLGYGYVGVEFMCLSI